MNLVTERGGRRLALLLPYAWLALFFLLPFLRVLGISFAEPEIAQPPYRALIGHGADGAWLWQATLANYRFLLDDAMYVKALGQSVRIAGTATLLCLLIGYPMAYALTRVRAAWRPLALMLVVLPFWTSFLLRIYAWIGLLNDHGTINNALITLGVIAAPLKLLKTEFAVQLGIVYAYLPFMVLPLYATLEQLDRELLDAAADLGCRPGRAFLVVTLPLSVPGIVAGVMLVFVPALGEFVIPDLLGGGDTLMLGRVLWEEFFGNRAWPVAAALAVVLLALVLLALGLQRWLLRTREARA